MTVDFPRAFQLIENTKLEDHHPECSWHHGILCDCDILMKHPEVLDDVMHTLDGITISVVASNGAEK